MSNFIQLNEEKIPEGLIFNKWLYNRLFLGNKNAIITTTGPTGSGKSYLDLRIAELWYKYLDRTFPINHCCFSIDEMIRLVRDGLLVRGDLMILEEGGVNLGSLDFQNKISKIFTYVLQSFRSLNLVLLVNLPYSSMLNKNVRMLTHCNLSTAGIDKETSTIKVKAKINQVNDQTGKIYHKYFRAKYQGGVRTFKRLNYTLPSPELQKEYERKKFKFVSTLVSGFASKLDEQERLERVKLKKLDMTPRQKEVYELHLEGLNQKQIAERLGIWEKGVHLSKKAILNKGFVWKKVEIPLENVKKMDRPSPIPYS